MRTNRLWVSLFAAGWLLVLSPGEAMLTAQEPADQWRAGVASVAITPQELTWMAGYAARTKPAEGKGHDLYAKALALEIERAGRREGGRSDGKDAPQGCVGRGHDTARNPAPRPRSSRPACRRSSATG